MKILKVSKKATVILGSIVLAAIFIFIKPFQPSIPVCTSQYPIQEVYATLDKDHTWRYWLLSKYDIGVNYPKNMEFLKKYEPETHIEIASYKGTVEDGINIGVFFEYRKQLNRIEKYVIIDSIRSGKKEGLRYTFFDGTLESVYGPSEQIKISFHEIKPSLIEIRNSDGTMMTVVNVSAPVRLVRDDKHEVQAGWKDVIYQTGEKCVESLKENGFEYWIVYNKEGKKLFKWPKNNDFCKARVFNENKAIALPLYFDMNEFEKIERKIHETEL